MAPGPSRIAGWEGTVPATAGSATWHAPYQNMAAADGVGGTATAPFTTGCGNFQFGIVWAGQSDFASTMVTRAYGPGSDLVGMIDNTDIYHIMAKVLGVDVETPAKQNDFRVEPYQQSPSEDGMLITWFTETATPGTLVVTGGDLTGSKEFTSSPEFMSELLYSELEEAGRVDSPDMFANTKYKHSIPISGLTAGTTYNYTVTQGSSRISNMLEIAPAADSLEPIRFIVYADSETQPADRTVKRDWGNRDVAPAAQAKGSTGRPDDLPRDARNRELYLATQFEGFAENIKIVESRDPDFIIMPGDLVQGGGYQRAWDEFFFHNAGQFNDLLSARPILPALGNWENFGAINTGYAPESVMASRAKYKAYFDKPANNNPNYQDLFYRIDYGPVTIITLDSSNGMPQGSDADTNVNIDEATYPGNDLACFNPGSDQWKWAEEQLADAKAKGQVIFVQFHHVPCSVYQW